MLVNIFFNFFEKKLFFLKQKKSKRKMQKKFIGRSVCLNYPKWKLCADN
jgi:hypothetical protein